MNSEEVWKNFEKSGNIDDYMSYKKIDMSNKTKGSNDFSSENMNLL